MRKMWPWLVGAILLIAGMLALAQYNRLGPADIDGWTGVGLAIDVLLVPGWPLHYAAREGGLPPFTEKMDDTTRLLNYGLFAIMSFWSWRFWTWSAAWLGYIFGVYDPIRYHKRKPWYWRWRAWAAERAEIRAKFGRGLTGGFASLSEVLASRFHTGDMFLGRPSASPGMLRAVGLDTDRHMVTIGGAGSGKSTGAMIPNLCIHRGSLLCIDPKGELARITAPRRGQGGYGVEAMGQAVHIMDPARITGLPGASYNVFDEMAAQAERDPDCIVGYAAKIGEAMVEVTGKDPYWDRMARDIITAMVLHVYLGPAEGRDLTRVRHLLMAGDEESFERHAQAGVLDRQKNTPHDALLADMVSAGAGPAQALIANVAANILRMPPNQQGSVWSMVQYHSSFLDYPEFARTCKTSSFLLADLKRQPTSVYLVLPLNMVTGIGQRWLRMFVLLLTDMMTREQAAPDPPILLAIDEFPSLGKLEGIDTVAPTMRSYGVRLWVAGQTVGQFKAVYPEGWETLVGNAEAVQFMGVKDHETVKMLMEFIGSHTVQQRGPQGEVRETQRPILDQEQIGRFLNRGGPSRSSGAATAGRWC